MSFPLLTLRQARAADASICVRIMNDWATETPWFPGLGDAQKNDSFLRQKVDDGFVILAQTPRVAGFMMLEEDYLNCLYVAESYRRAGIGKKLIDHAKTQSGVIRLWTFQANVAAQRFYLREGFHETRRTDGDNEEKLPDIEFVWQPEQAQP